MLRPTHICLCVCACGGVWGGGAGAAGRSNNYLDTTKLETTAKELNMRLPDIHTAVREAMAAARATLEASGAPATLHSRLAAKPRPLPRTKVAAGEQD